MTTNLKSCNSFDAPSVLNSELFLNQLKNSYQAEQQVKYLKLQAEVDLLLHQIKTARATTKI